MKIYISTILLLFCAFTISAQKKASKKTNSLSKVIYQYAAGNIKTLNKTGSMGKYRVNWKNTFYSDVDSDGDFDAIVEIVFCEFGSCHPTTQSSKLAVFIKNKNKFIFAAEKRFVLYGKIDSIDGNKIVVGIYSLEGEDPQCCPDLKRYETYEFKNNKLSKVKNED